VFEFCTFNDVDETWLKRSSSDQKSVNILYLNQLVTILFSNTASVNDSAVSGFLVNSFQIFSDPGVNFIDLFSSGSLSCSNGPNWFISQDNVVPVSDFVFNGIELSLNDFNCSVFFSFSESLTETENNFQSEFQTILNF